VIPSRRVLLDELLEPRTMRVLMYHEWILMSSMKGIFGQLEDHPHSNPLFESLSSFWAFYRCKGLIDSLLYSTIVSRLASPTNPRLVP
jgi:hypothetical protein